MAHGVASEGGVVGFDIEGKLVEQAVFAQEVQASGGVRVVLVRGGFAGLGLDPERAVETDFFFPGHGHVEEGGELIELVLHVGVPERGIAFASTPENIAFTAEFFGHGDGFFDLCGGIGVNGQARRGSAALGVARMCKEAGGAPEELLAGALLLLGERAGDSVERGVRLGESVEFGGHIAVVEAVEVDVDLLEEFKEDAHALLGVGNGVRSVIPGHQRRAAAKGIGERVAHHMPVGGGEAQMVSHRLALDEFVGIVLFKGEGIFGFRPFEGDLWDAGEVFSAHGFIGGFFVLRFVVYCFGFSVFFGLVK